MNKKLLMTGFIGGVIVTLLLTVFFRSARSSSAEGVIAEVGNEKLSLSELRKEVAAGLIPVENDEYRILKQGVEEWVDERLLEKAAKEGGLSLEGLYQKELWSRVQVSSSEISDYYNKNRELFRETFESASPGILQELRRQKYAQAKKDYLKELARKYEARIHLKKPKSYVEGLSVPLPILKGEVPTGEGAAPGTPTPAPPAKGESPFRGSKDAPIVLEEFADFHCGFCKRVKPTLEKLFESYPGKIRWVFRHFPLSRVPGSGSFLTHEAAACAHEQGKFWPYHDAIFALPSAPAEADLYAISENVGLNGAQFKNCLTGGKYRNFIQEDVKSGSQKGVSGTPTMFLNDKTVAGAYPYEHFAGIVDHLLNPAAVPPPTLEEPEEPSKPISFKDLEGRPSRGPAKAPVTLVEFSDFHCPFCQRLTPTLEKIEKNYAGKIRRVWRHYPLAMHAGADRTHEASECAHEQGKFWEYHDKLFQTIGQPKGDTELIRLAESAGLNKKKFEKCLSEGKYKNLVQKEIAAGNQAGVQGTPAVFVNGELVAGAQPYESFDQIIKSKLGKSS